MQLSRFSDYAVRTLIYLSTLDDGDLATVREISVAYNLSYNHLVKVVHRLSSLNIVKSKSGKHGGITLNADPSTLKIGVLLRELEPSSDLLECFSDDKDNCVISPVCRLKGHFKKAQNAFYDTLNNVSLEEICSNKSELKAILKT